MQSPASSTHAILAYFEKVDPAFAKEVGPALEPIDDDWASQDLESLPLAVQAATKEAVKKIAQRIEKEYMKPTEREYRLARIHARAMTDFLLAQGSNFSVRDRSMADIAADLLEVEGPKSKMVLWAHNGHISENTNAGMPTMGSYLAKRFGDGYFTFGFAFDEGSFQAIDVGPDRRGLIPFAVPSAPPGSLDHTLARTGIPIFALSLRGAPKGVVSDWLSVASATRSIGAVYNDRVSDFATAMDVPGEHFDALFFIRKTTAARPHETSKRSGVDAQQPLSERLQDPGFERAKAGELPAGWKVEAMPRQLVYRAAVSADRCASGKRCLVMIRDKAGVSTGIGTATASVDAAPYHGKKVRILAALRVEGKGPGDEAFLSAHALSPKQPPGVPNKTAWAQVPGSSWTKVQVELDVAQDAERIVIRLVVTGAAKAAMDDIEVGPAGDEPEGDKAAGGK
jgi:erythromycin esterase